MPDNAAQAAAIVLTRDHPASALHAMKAIRHEYPQVWLFARSHDEKHALTLTSLLQNAATLWPIGFPPAYA